MSGHTHGSATRAKRRLGAVVLAYMIRLMVGEGLGHRRLDDPSVLERLQETESSCHVTCRHKHLALYDEETSQCSRFFSSSLAYIFRAMGDETISSAPCKSVAQVAQLLRLSFSAPSTPSSGTIGAARVSDSRSCSLKHSGKENSKRPSDRGEFRLNYPQSITSRLSLSLQTASRNWQLPSHCSRAHITAGRRESRALVSSLKCADFRLYH